jgi:hypothetical protein
MNARVIVILALVALLATSACAAASSPSSAVAPAESSGGRAAPAPAAAPPAPRQQGAAAGAASNAQADQTQPSVPSLDRMIIRTVTMTIAVDNVQDVFHKVEALAASQNGYVASSQMRQDGDRLTGTVTLRVPADSATYQSTLEQLRGFAKEVVDEQSQAQDVTDQYVDLDARLRNLRASEESLLQVLAKAQKVEDILQVQRELTNVRGQIEQIQGQKQVLERKADLATINLTIRDAGTVARAGWNPGTTFQEAYRALGSALRGLAIFAIWLAVFSPIWGGFLALIWLFVWLVFRVFRRRSGSRPLSASGPPPAAAAPPIA